MNKKLIILIVFIGIITGTLLFWDVVIKEENVVTEEEINRVLSLIKENIQSEFKDEHDDSFVKKESLINLVHITKKGSEYEISCFLGSAYENANLNKMFPDKLVSMGQIKECNVETAKLIDEAVKSEERECDVFTSHISPMLNDYYFFAIKIEDREVTQELIEDLSKKWMDGEDDALQCFKPMENLLGETIAKHGTGIVDLDENVLYF